MTETDISVSADGSRVFVEGRGHLTMASGKTCRNRYVMRFDFVGGKIKHCKEYYNPIQSAYAFGRKIAGQFTIEALHRPHLGISVSRAHHGSRTLALGLAEGSLPTTRPELRASTEGFPGCPPIHRRYPGMRH